MKWFNLQRYNFTNNQKSWLNSIISNSDESYRRNSWKIFQKWVKGLSNHQKEMVIIEMLDAPITSVITAGLQLLKDFVSDPQNSCIKSSFLNTLIMEYLLNINSNLYRIDSDDILNNNDLFKDRIKVMSHVVNLCKFLKMKTPDEFMVFLKF